MAEHSGVVVCGSSENVTACYKLFDRLAIIRVTRDELLRNLASPERSNPFGKTTKQRAGFMEWQDFLISEAGMFSPVFIDGNAIEATYRKVVSLAS